MTDATLQAYCFYKAFEPEAPKQMTFDRHYLLYSAKGALRIEVEDRRWTLPPSRAAWIPAGVNVTMGMSHPMVCCSILFHPDFIDAPTTSCRVFALTPIARDMILHTRRWGPDSEKLDDHAVSFFKTLAYTCTELAEAPSDVWIPKGRSEPLQRALSYTQENLAKNLTLGDVASSARLSERSLARRFSDETGMTWRQMLRRMRMIQAIELLSNADDQVLNIALTVGYESLSAFNKAFREFSGHTPSDFRKKYS